VDYAPLVVERLDEERLEMLRSWGAGLSTSGRDELRAAGKAILMLIEEIERLQVDVWNARAAANQAAAQRSSQSIATTLRDRLSQRHVTDEPTT
jgi:type IV pilus biogenesis protein CpaD/CtpE